MIERFNHTAKTLNATMSIDDKTTKEIIEICENYIDSLSVSSILEDIQKNYGVCGMVIASYILGQLTNNSNPFYYSINLN